jgi:copper transport protein
MFRATLESGESRLKVEVEPGGRGPNVMHLYAYTLQDRPLPVQEWTVTASAPGAEPVDVPVLQLTDNHATGTLTLSAAGQWRLDISADRESVTTTISIR